MTSEVKDNRKKAKQSVLYDCHLKLTAKSRIVPFGGYLMPLWYSSISNEHNAVRQAAGLFDCTHMGVLEIKGVEAEDFINVIATNNAATLQKGKAQYSYILDSKGKILDDIIVYRRDDSQFMVVVNAANEPKIKKYLADLQQGKAVIDEDDPDRKLPQPVEIRDMRDTKSGTDSRVDIALQGPASVDIVMPLVNDKQKEQLKNLKPFSFIEGTLDGIDCIISRTGYTGAKIGYELFVRPGDAVKLWEMLLEKGKIKGLIPCGLGARDSLRIEAGLPLYGHELDGLFDISPFEAGYGWAVKLDKEFFIGKAAARKRADNYNMKVARMELPGRKGIRPVRQNDCVVNKDGRCIGYILSSAKAGDRQIALAFIKKESAEEGDVPAVHYMPRKAAEQQRIELGEKAEGNINGKVVSRFTRF